MSAQISRTGRIGGKRHPLSVAALASMLAVSASADEIGVDDRRISEVGGLGDAQFDVSTTRIATVYNSTDHEFLVVWAADDPDAGLVDGETEIFVQRIDAATGEELGIDDQRISDMGGTGDSNDDARYPAVAYNSVDNEYLVVWEGNEDEGGTVLLEWEIYVQRLDAATGEELGTNDHRISAMGGLGSTAFYGITPAVAYDPTHSQYLVAWAGSHDQGGQVAGEPEIFVQRLDAATGAEIGTDDQRISAMSGLGDPAFGAFVPAVIYNPLHDEFLVAWYGDEASLFQVDNEFEIFVQRLDAASGAEVGPDDHRVSFAGPNLDSTYAAGFPSVAFNPIGDRYLVVFSADDDTPPLVDEEYEVFAQLLDGGTADLVGTVVRVSDMGPPGNPAFDGGYPHVAWSSVDQEFLVAWFGDDGANGLADDEMEIYLQRLNADLEPQGIDDERLSSMGGDGDPDSDALLPALAYNPLHNEALVVWIGDDDALPLLDNEFEVYSQRWIQPLLFADDFESGDTSAWSQAAP